MPFPYLIDFYMEKYCAFRRKKMLYTFLQFSRIFQIFKQYFFWRCIRINFIDFFWTTSNTYFRLIYQLSKNIQKYLWNSKEISQCTASWVPHIFASDLKKNWKNPQRFSEWVSNVFTKNKTPKKHLWGNLM